MNNIFEIKVSEYREKLSDDIELHNMIYHIFTSSRQEKKTKMKGKDDFLRTCSGFIYLFNGNWDFPDLLKRRFDKAVEEEILNTSFRNNYRQTAEKYWNVKYNNTYYNFLFGDMVMIRLGNKKGTPSVYGKETSDEMQKYITTTILDYTIGDVITDVKERIIESDFFETANSKRTKTDILDNIILFTKVLASICDIKENYEIADTEYEQEKAIRENENLPGYVKESLVLSRRGQGRFRSEVLLINDHCPFTDISDPHLLIASHIKPWKDYDEYQKVDPHNGFMFTPTYDKLFDQGYISFSDEGTLLVSTHLSEDIATKLELYTGKIMTGLNIEEETIPYLKYHREKIFKVD